MKVLTKEDVRTVAKELVKNGKTTTNRDIKNELREEGFWATQRDVKFFMDEIAHEEDFGITSNGLYNTYTEDNSDSFILDDDNDDNDDDQSTFVTHGNFAVSKPQVVTDPGTSGTNSAVNTANSKRNRLEYPAAITAADAEMNGGWKVSSTVRSEVMYFPASESRDTVRCAYRKEFNVPMSTTRSKKIK